MDRKYTSCFTSERAVLIAPIFRTGMLPSSLVREGVDGVRKKKVKTYPQLKCIVKVTCGFHGSHFNFFFANFWATHSNHTFQPTVIPLITWSPCLSWPVGHSPWSQLHHYSVQYLEKINYPSTYKGQNFIPQW